MQSFKKIMVLGGLIVGAGLHADHCSKAGVSIANRASVPGVNYTLYVNIGEKAKKSEAVVFGLTAGYAVLQPEQSLCFKNAFKKSSIMFVRQANQKGEPKKPAYKFDIKPVYELGMAEIKSIDIVSGPSGFELKVYGLKATMGGTITDGMMHLVSTELVDMNTKKTEGKKQAE